jgi:PAS domain S-box-containing protein
VDITERRHAEESLNATREKMEHVFETSPAAIYVVTLDPATGALNLVNFVNSTICSMVGYSLEHWHDPSFWPAHVHPEDYQRVMNDQARLFETGELRHEYRFRHENGNWVWVDDHLVLVQDEKGKPLEIVGAWLDITSLKRIEQDIAELNRVYRFTSKVSEAVVRVSNRDEFLDDICRIAVQEGGFMMAWIGLFIEEDYEVLPIARYGDDAGYVDGFLKGGAASWA